MPVLGPTAVPSYRLHKQSGQAIVTLDGRDICLGKHGTPQSREKYNRLIGEWLANGRRLPAPPSAYTVTMLLAAFWEHAQTHYRHADGTPTSEIANYRDAMRPLRRLYGEALATGFGPLSLKALRGEMIRLGWCRTHINRQIGRIRHVFKWGVENELVPASVHQGLVAVAGLRAGRSEAKESAPVRPVPDPHVDAIKDHVSRQVWGMIELQRLTGMRPGEVAALRGCDLDAGGDVWTFTPARHKTQHHGHERIVYFGPQAQAVVQQFLKPDVQAFLFSPADAERERREQLHEERKRDGTPLSCGNTVGTNRTDEPRRTAGERYTVEAYCKAIYAGCDAAFLPPPELARQRVPARGRKGKRSTRWETPAEWKARLAPEKWAELAKWREEHRWHPHQLRHNAATRLRKQYGLEAARVILGHKSAAVAEVYAEIDQAKARQIMGEVG